MSKIIPKLNLNKTPQMVDNYSMIFAKNVKLLKDSTLGQDDSYSLLGQNVETALTGYIIIDTISYNTKFYIFAYKQSEGVITESAIFEYNELTKEINKINCNWNYSGGKIDGCVTINLRNEILLTIGEYFENNVTKLIPIKTINLSTCTNDDDETIYTQTPKIPLLNLELAGTYNCVIPPGVYQFFVRYEIKKDYFSKWLPCSVELFTATPNVAETAQGALRFINKNEDSNSSFIFTPQFTDNVEYDYVSYQLGFLLSTNETVVARSWKKFKFDTNIIYFDYDQDYIEELDVKDILSDIIGYYNIKNITYFKNKLYLSNYIESNINPDLEDEAKKWSIEEIIDVASAEFQTKYYYKSDETVSLPIAETNITGQSLPFVYGTYNPSTDKVDYTEISNYSMTNNVVDAILELNTNSIYDVLFSRRNTSFNHAFLNGNHYDNIFCKNVNNDYCNILVTEIIELSDEQGSAYGSGSDNYYIEAEEKALKSIATNAGYGYRYYYPELSSGCYSHAERNQFPTSFVKLGFDIEIDNTEYIDHPEIHPRDRSASDGIIHLTASVNERIGSHDLSTTVYPEREINYDSVVFANEREVWELQPDNTFIKKDIDINDTPTNIFADLAKSIEGIVTRVKITGTNVDYSYDNTDIISKLIIKIYDYQANNFTKRIVGDSRYLANQPSEATWDGDYSFISIPIEIHYPVLTDSLENGIYTVEAREYIKKIIYKVKITTNKVSTKTAVQELGTQTLLPFQKYKFFIHYITKYGEITNGYQIDKQNYPDGFYYNITKDLIDLYSENKGDFDQDDVLPLIYPKFYKNFEASVPDTLKEYQGYFFSYAKTKGTFYALTNREKLNNSNDYIFDCIDADVLNTTFNDNVVVYCLNVDGNTEYDLNELKQYTGTYVYSGDYDPSALKLFGSSGKILVKNIDDADKHCLFFIRINNENNSEYLQLTKCTQYYNIQDTIDRYYIDKSTGNADPNKIQAYNPENFNLGGYLIKLNKPTTDELQYFYSAGKKYEKTIGGENNYLKLTEDPSVILIIKRSHIFYKTYSNYNVNFLYLSEGVTSITPKIRDYTSPNSGTQVLTMLESLTLSSIYTFDKTYKDYTKKQFNIYSKDNITTFDNTVRASELEIDEGKTYIYRFNIDDEYNVPTNKGKIVNLLGIGDYVIVHTENSIFKFTGKVRFNQQDNSVQVIESDIFDTGITEITGSDYGYAGLVKKEHAFVCQFGYIYWDAEANTIFYYNGDQEPSPISDPIFKLLNLDKIQNITFCADYDNDRFFINIKYTNITSPVVLSYNFKAKAFISLHDFDFDKAFNTKSHYYLIKTINNNNKIYKVDKTSQYYPQELLFTDKLYPQKYTISKQYSIVDIIINENYENIKALNYIEWICKKIIHTFVPSQNKNVETDRLSEEDEIVKYAGDYIMIYTDSTKTALLDITQANEAFKKALYKKEVEQESEEEININNEIIYQEVNEENRDYNNSPVISEMYKLPRYNLGKWTLNYFRNVLDTTDITYSGSLADQQSLIYGKYFIIRLIFDKGNNFKLENIDINYKY